MKRILPLAAIGIAVLAALIWLAFGRGEGPEPWLGYVEGEAIEVAAPVSGQLAALNVQRGGQVTAGQPLFALNAATTEAELKRLRAQLASAQAQRDDLAKALLAHFTGHLSISTTMRAHAGIGTSQAHLTVSTAPMTVTVTFHEPVGWDGWLSYTHESTQVGAGMSYVRGQVHTEDGRLIASFTQEGMIRPLRTTDSAVAATARL